MHLMIHLPGHIPSKGLRKPQGSGESSESLQWSATSTLILSFWLMLEARKLNYDDTYPFPTAPLPEFTSLLPLQRTAIPPNQRRLPSLPDSTTFYHLLSSEEGLLKTFP